MAFEEKRAWLAGVVAAISYLVYLAVMVVRSRGVPVTDTAYVGPLLVVIGTGVLVTIAGVIVLGLQSPDEAGQADERDREIDRLGTRVAQSFVVIGSVAALIMALVEWDHFWIANVLVLGFFLSAMCEAVTKVAAYHGAFQSW
jgi:hypothetical protein